MAKIIAENIFCCIFAICGGQRLYDKITAYPALATKYSDDHLSCGEESLIPEYVFGEIVSLHQPSSQVLKGIASRNFAAAVNLFTEAFQEEADAETLIYLNNAKIKLQFPAKKIYTIAVAVPLERRTAIGLEILQGVAQAQTEALEKGQPLRIIIADDSNRQDSKTTMDNNARKIAQELIKYRDLLAVVGHYSSEATKQSLPIYTSSRGIVNFCH